jgi:hypothetical protein
MKAYARFVTGTASRHNNQAAGRGNCRPPFLFERDFVWAELYRHRRDYGRRPGYVCRAVDTGPAAREPRQRRRLRPAANVPQQRQASPDPAIGDRSVPVRLVQPGEPIWRGQRQINGRRQVGGIKPIKGPAWRNTGQRVSARANARAPPESFLFARYTPSRILSRYGSSP